MPSHPDADSFMRAILRNPAELTTRLVFADWLEETGEPSNVAWARYIRLMADANRYPEGSFERYEREWFVPQHAARIQAHLTIPAVVYVTHTTTIPQLLPLSHITVRLRGFTPEPHTKALLCKQMLELYRIFPLTHENDSLCVAMADLLANAPAVLEDLRNLLGLRQVSAVHAERNDLHQAIGENSWPSYELRTDPYAGTPLEGLETFP
jgi:uncharacterized protein (TIGR02996 family)